MKRRRSETFDYLILIAKNSEFNFQRIFNSTNSQKYIKTTFRSPKKLSFNNIPVTKIVLKRREKL